MSAIADARTALHDALALGLVDQPWRVHRTSPDQIAAPSVWIDSVSLVADGPFVVATFPVYVVADGAVRRQVEALDDLLARLWTVSESVGLPQSARPQPLDVGGSSLRAHAMDVQIPLDARTLCPLDLINQEGPTP
jgi:hypothetical protein